MPAHSEATAADPDASTKLAIQRTVIAFERTMLAWVRTATSLITFGFSIQQFFRNASAGAPDSGRFIGPREVGLAMIIIGLLALLLAALDHRSAIRALRVQYPFAEQSLLIPRSRAGLMAGLIALLGLLSLASMWLRS
jgi:putative membrane protein